MLKNSILAVGLLFGAAAAAMSPGADKPPVIQVETEVSRFVKATECYVVFLLEGTGESMLAARENFERKYRTFSRQVKADFPGATEDVISVNAGTRDFNSYRAGETPFSPHVAKILLFTLPPDEAAALKLLDLGVKLGVAPFCGTSANGTFGAVFYGIRNADDAIERLYPLALAKLERQAKQHAAALNRDLAGMRDLYRYAARENPCEIRFKEIKLRLPCAFFGSDPNRIPVSLALRMELNVRPRQPAL